VSETVRELFAAADKLQAEDDPEAAEALLRRAVRLAPAAAEAHGRLGIALRALERFDEALAAFDTAAECDPALATPHSEAGFTLATAGRPAEAVARYRRALELKPEQPEVRWNLALLLLQLGQYEEGWALFEARWALPRFAKKLPQLRSPVWRGEDIAGKALLVLPEQGFGDNIQFARFARLAGERGARVVLVTRPPVTRLFSTLRGGTEVRTDELPLPDCDYHVPIMGLPHALGTALATIPAAVPYLAADPGAVGRWRARLGGGEPLRVGLVWSSGVLTTGQDLFMNAMAKSLPVAALAPLARVPNVAFYSLQKFAGAHDPAAHVPPKGLRLVDWTAELADFADTAAFVEALDLVISVDTSVAHLAGALGKRVWVPLPANADWRYLREREDSPWYPTMRLFRQRSPGIWREPVAEAAEALAALAGGERRARRGVLSTLFRWRSGG
jgi:hypothetical protein